MRYRRQPRLQERARWNNFERPEGHHNRRKRALPSKSKTGELTCDGNRPFASSPPPSPVHTPPLLPRSLAHPNSSGAMGDGHAWLENKEAVTRCRAERSPLRTRSCGVKDWAHIAEQDWGISYVTSKPPTQNSKAQARARRFFSGRTSSPGPRTSCIRPAPRQQSVPRGEERTTARPVRPRRRILLEGNMGFQGQTDKRWLLSWC